MRRTDVHQGVDEILQADVMRFLAIIAICLIAILALVRGAEPVERAAAAPVTPQTPVAPQTPVTPQTSPRPAPVAETAPDRASERMPEPAATPADPAPDPDAQDLSLRFASDADFLRLVNRGDIRLFAFRDGEVLAVGAGLELTPAAAPAQLHELLPETIPEAVAAALRRRGGGGEFRWGVVMPERLARAIRGYVNRGAAGELVIDRFGEVRHHEA